METRFGHDFASVRVHTDERATESARAVDAAAYTVGENIVFGRGHYTPDSGAGQLLLAHELTHVVQQRQSSIAGQPQKQLEMSHASDAGEREADRVANRVMAGEPVHVSEHPGALIQGGWLGTGLGALSGAATGALIGGLIGGPLGALIGAGIGAIAGGIAGYLLTRGPLFDMSTFQSPGGSGWWGAKFGCYRDGCTRRHPAWDIHAPAGTNVYSVTAGTMAHGENPGGWGHYVTLTSKSDPTRRYLYGHLSAREKAGDFVPGSKLGETGTSGNAQANRPHLHFEVQTNHVAIDPTIEFTEPSKVVEQTGSAVTSIDKSLPAPCAPCAM